MIERRKPDSGGRRLSKPDRRKNGGRRAEDSTDMKRSYILPHYAVTPAPAVPTALTAVAVSSSQINLIWTASVGPSLKDYGVYRQGTGLLGFVTATSFNDTGLSASTAYTYYVTARNVALVESAPSNFASATTQIASSFTHGQPLTITGGPFGLKSGNTPTAWDHGQDGAGTLNAAWTGTPTVAGNPLANMVNRAIGVMPSGSNIVGPHPFTQVVAAGCHFDFANSSNQVGIFRHLTRPARPYYFYGSYYHLVDPAWQFTGTPANYKFGTVYAEPTDNTPIPGSSIDYCWTIFPTDNTTATFGPILADDQGGLPNQVIQNPDNNGHNAFWGGVLNPMKATTGWVKWEYVVRWSDKGDPSGYVRIYQNNVQVCNYSGSTQYNTSAVGQVCIRGSYARDRAITNFRFYTDNYDDDLQPNLARFVLTNSAAYTVGGGQLAEIQPYTAWANGSVTLTINKGKLASGTARLWFVDEASGVIPTLQATGTLN